MDYRLFVMIYRLNQYFKSFWHQIKGNIVALIFISLVIILHHDFNVIFGSWKVLKKKNIIKKNDFLLLDFVIKNINKIKYI